MTSAVFVAPFERSSTKEERRMDGRGGKRCVLLPLTPNVRHKQKQSCRGGAQRANLKTPANGSCLEEEHSVRKQKC